MGKWIKELKRPSVFYYIFTFSALVILIIAVMGIYLYQFYYRTIYADFRSANSEHLQTMENRHENDMQIMSDIVYQMGIADEVTAFFLEKDPQKAIRLEDQLHQYMSVSQSFMLLLYSYHLDSYLYSDTTSVRRDSFFANCVLEKVDPETFRTDFETQDKQLRIYPEQSVSGRWIRRYVPGVRVVLYMQAIAPEFEETMLFFVPDSYYDELMEGEAAERRTDYIVYGGQVIVSRGEQAAPETEEAVVSLLADSLEQRCVEIGGESCLLTAEKGESGLIYCTLQPLDIFHDKIFTEQWGIIALLLLCAFPAGLVITALSRRLTDRVRRINGILNAGEEVSYNLGDIESGIQTLLASNEQKELESRQLKKTRFVRNFVRNDFEDAESAEKAASDAQIGVKGRVYLVTLLGGRGDSNEDQAHAQMLNIIAQSAHLDGYGVRLVVTGQSLFLLFADRRELLEEVLGRIFTVGRECYENFVMAASNYHTLLTEGSAAYLEADTAFDNRFLQDNNKIIRFSEVSAAEPAAVLSEAHLQNLRYALKNRDKEAVRRSIEEICMKMTKESPSLFTFRMLYNDIIHVLIAEWKGDSAEVTGLYNVFALSQCLTVQDFNDLLYEACSSIIDSRPQERLEETDVVRRAMRYMQEHFSDPNLTISALAEELGVSSVTLAVIFRNELGVRPSDYLANLRMEQARELLVNTDMLIREIGRMVGYEDDHVFTRRFKKYTGKTPGQYREEKS